MPVVLSESYLHRLDPFAIQFTDNFGIRWYGLSYMAGFLIGWLLIRWLARSGRSTLPPEAVGDFLFYLIAGVIVGGRLGYCIFYQPSLLWPPWGILMVWHGGMASHGGMIGVILGAIFFARRYKLPALHLIDVGAFTCPPGLGLGRLANFVNAELWGKPLPGPMQGNPPWWSVKYPEEILSRGFPRAAALEKLKDLVPAGGGFREKLVAAVQSGDQKVIDAIRPLLTAYYPSQIFQAISDGVVLFVVLAIAWLWPRRPGVIAGLFLVTYGILRIFTEIYRQPDEGVALLPTPFGDLSRGQVLSVLMVLCGIVMVILCACRRVPRLGGLVWRADRGGAPDTGEAPSGEAPSGEAAAGEAAAGEAAAPAEGDQPAAESAETGKRSGKSGRKKRKR